MSLRFGNVRVSNAGVTVANSAVKLTANGLTCSNVIVTSKLNANVVQSSTETTNVLFANVVQSNSVTANIMIANTITLSNANAFSGNYNTLTNTPVIPSIADYGANTSTASNLAVINKPLLGVNNQGTNVLNTRVYTGTSLSASNGTVTFYPTTTGAAGATPLFSQILTVQGSLWLNTTTATSVPNIAGKSISSDLSTVVFNLTVGSTSGIIGGGASAVFAGNNIPCMCMIIGI